MEKSNNLRVEYVDIQMLKDYLLHVLQYGTPEERVKILAGVNSKFQLTNRQLLLE